MQIAGTPIVELDTSGGWIPVQQQGPASVQGTVGIDPANNTVTLANPPSAPPAPEPYQWVLEVDPASTGNTCVSIPVPTGRTLRIDNVGIQAFANSVAAAKQLEAGIRLGDSTFLNAVTHPVELSGDGALQRGQAQVTLLVGSIEKPARFDLDASVCLMDAPADSNPEFVATITGELLQS